MKKNCNKIKLNLQVNQQERLSILRNLHFNQGKLPLEKLAYFIGGFVEGEGSL
jgi:hypothetical protein